MIWRESSCQSRHKWAASIKTWCTTLLMGIVAGPVSANVIVGINHTHRGIEQFSVDGRSAIDSIGPYQGGGGACCFMTAARWQPGMTVRIDWETGASGVSKLADEFPGFADEAKYDAWLDKVQAQKRRHSKIVSVPDYTNQQTCGITVHFLPCDDVQVTTSCHVYGSPGYPIKAPLRSPNPPSCPHKEH